MTDKREDERVLRSAVLDTVISPSSLLHTLGQQELAQPGKGTLAELRARMGMLAPGKLSWNTT